MSQQASGLGIYLLYIHDCLREYGGNSAALFCSAGVTDIGRLQRGQRVSMPLLASVIRQVALATRHSGFFLQVGTRIPVVAHGNLGTAIMTSRDVRTVLETTERFAAIALSPLRIEHSVDGSKATIAFRIATQCRDVDIALAEVLSSTIARHLPALTDAPFVPQAVEFTHAEPAYAKLYGRYLGRNIRFGAAENRMIFPAQVLDLRVVTADEVSRRLTLRQCEDELLSVQGGQSLSHRARELLVQYLRENPSITFVAERLHMSERSLRRRLREEGVNFRDLLKAVRHETALYYLQQPEMRIEGIAACLGYRDTACFRRAFSDATGLAPREYRSAQAVTRR